MGATYTRQSDYSDGDTIVAADTNDEFDQLLAAFAASSGHTHDGTAAEGGPITKLLGHTLTFGTGSTGTDITITFDGETNDGVLKWMEDEDYFEFSDDILVASTEKIQFGDTASFIQQSSNGVLRIDGEATVDINASTAVLVSNDLKLDSDAAILGMGVDNDVTLTHVADTGILLNSTRQLQFGDSGTYIHQSADGVLDLVSDTEIEINATTIDINGAVDVSGEIAAASLDISGAIDVDGTTNLDVVDIDGAVDMASTLTVAGVVDITDTTDSSDATGDTGALRTEGGASIAKKLYVGTDLDVDGTANLDAVDIDGAVDMASTLATGGLYTAGAGITSTAAANTFGATSFNDADITNVGGIALDTITNDGTDITLDSSGDIILDAAGNNITIKSAGTSILDIANNSTDVELTVSTADKNFAIKGTDGSSAITALDIDMALAGKATFSGDVVVTGDLTITGDDLVMGTNTSGHILVADGTNFNPIAVGDLSEISTVANDDVFLAVDTSGGGLKKITRSAVVSGLATSSGISNIVEDTSPQLGANLDTNSHNILIDDAHFIADENGNEQIIFQTTSSAVNQFDVTNAATGSGPTISSTGSDTNINLNLTPKGSGVVMIDGNVGIDSGTIDLKNGGSVSNIKFYCESSNAHYTALQSAAHSAYSGNVTLTLPASTDTIVGRATTDTFTNKTFGGHTSFGDYNITNVGDIALDSISADGTDINVAVSDNSATALTIKQGSDAYLIIDTANSSESVSIGTGISGTAITIGHGTSEVTFGDNVTVTGDFTVNGTTTTVATTNLTVEDPLVKYGQGYTGTAYDQGFIITRGDGSSSNTANRGFIWDESADEFATIAANTEAGTTAGNVTINDYVPLHVGAITADDNSTFSGEIAAASLDISGNVDVDGTTNLDVVDIDGAVDFASTTAHAGNATFADSAKVQLGAGADLQIFYDGSNAFINNTVAGALSIKSDDINLMSSASETMATFVENGAVTLYHDNAAKLATASGGVTVTGTFEPSGKITADAGIDIDNFNIDGTTIALSSGHMTLDAAGQVILDSADAGSTGFADSGTTYGNIYASSGSMVLKSTQSDKDMLFQGNDGGSQITALTLDMSDAGAATFNGKITADAGIDIDNFNIDGTTIGLSSGNLTLDVAGEINIDAGGGNINILDDGTSIAYFGNSSSNFVIQSTVSDKDLIFKGNDGGSTITALTLDMSAAGAATFNNDVTAFSDERLKSNITTIPDALSKVSEMRGVHYVRDATGKDSSGVIAQELQKIAPELVLTADDEMGTLSVNYGNITGYLIEAIKELKAEIEVLKGK
jgi:cytoskeletal protein CcmA (bactofilin family)